MTRTRWQEQRDAHLAITNSAAGAFLSPVHTVVPAIVDARNGRRIDISQLRPRRGPGFRADAWPALRSAHGTGTSPA